MQQGNKITGFRIPFTANARASLYHVTKFSLISSFAFYYYHYYYYLLLFVLFLVFLLFCFLLLLQPITGRLVGTKNHAALLFKSRFTGMKKYAIHLVRSLSNFDGLQTWSLLPIEFDCNSYPLSKNLIVQTITQV